MAKVLVIDDSRTSRKILKNILEELGHTVIGEAADGEEGYQLYQVLQPELTTLDITMPRMDGIEALQLIKELDKEAKVIMITAAGQKDKMVRSVKYGASDFICKPIDRDAVEEIVNRVLGVE